MRTRMRSVIPLLLSLFAAPGVLGGCAGAAGDHPSEASSGSVTSSSTGQTSEEAADADGAPDVPAFPANTDADTAAASTGAAVTVRDIRLGGHDGFDRVVFEVGGAGTPGWDVRYVDAASSQGSGAAVDVAGDAVLQVSLSGVGYPYDTGVTEYARHGPLSAEGTRVVTEVVYDATFEGVATAFVGTRTRAPFRVYQLQNPTRVVLEVAGPA